MLLVDPPELGAFQRQVVHEPLIAEHETDDRVAHVVSVYLRAHAGVDFQLGGGPGLNRSKQRKHEQRGNDPAGQRHGWHLIFRLAA